MTTWWPGLTPAADDYVSKPFTASVLLARLRAVLRRQTGVVSHDTDIEHGPLVIRIDRCEVVIDGEPCELTATELGILSCLAREPARVFTRSQILNSLHDGPTAITDRAIDVHMVSLRRKLGRAAGLVETIRGIGYRMAKSLDETS